MSRPKAKRRSSIVCGIERIDERDADPVVLFADRQRAMQTREAGRDEMEDLRSEFDRVEIHHLAPEGLGNREVELMFVDNPVIDHRLLDRFPVLGRLEQNVVGLGLVHQALVDEKIGESFVVHVENEE